MAAAAAIFQQRAGVKIQATTLFRGSQAYVVVLQFCGNDLSTIALATVELENKTAAL